MSGGRLNFGLGAGWFELEHRAFDVAFPKINDRLHMLDEALDVIRLLWTERQPTYTGKYYQLQDAYFAPKPLQQPHPPIMIGAAGEKLALRIVAKHANMWNTLGSPEVFRQKIGVLQRHCLRLGRNVEEIEKSVLISLVLSEDRGHVERVLQGTAARMNISPDEVRARSLAGTRAQVINQIEAFVEVGVTHFILMLSAPYDHDALRLFAEEVMPYFRR
jgi:alkanesulfonate monooxygenase SsuD/methylene tetrahydromethanopterin reductase-like flavin-dependent oxidoreductase (luciferase family)